MSLPKRPRLDSTDLIPTTPLTSSESLQPTCLNRNLRSIFASYYLLASKDQLQFSYYDSKNENSYLIGATPAKDVLRVYFINNFWRNSTRSYMLSLGYKVIIESTGGRRLKYSGRGRVLTDSGSLKSSRVSQNLALLTHRAISYAIRCDQLDLLFEFGLLTGKATGLDFSHNSTSALKHTVVPYLKWFSALQELDFSPVFPPKSMPMLRELIAINLKTLKRLYLPNFILGHDLKLDQLQLEHLKKSFMHFLTKNELDEPIQSFLPYFSVHTKTLEFTMVNLINCYGLPPNFRLNPQIEALELAFKTVKEPVMDRFDSWIKAASKWESNLKKLVFIAHSLYVAKGESNSTLASVFFTKNQLLLQFILYLNQSLLAEEHSLFGFEFAVEFDIRCNHKEVRPNLRIGGHLITMQFTIDGRSRHSGIYVSFKRNQKLISSPIRMDPTNEFMDFCEQIRQQWLIFMESLD